MFNLTIFGGFVMNRDRAGPFRPEHSVAAPSHFVHCVAVDLATLKCPRDHNLCNAVDVLSEKPQNKSV
jgi:hypothetical protein